MVAALLWRSDFCLICWRRAGWLGVLGLVLHFPLSRLSTATERCVLPVCSRPTLICNLHFAQALPEPRNESGILFHASIISSLCVTLAHVNIQLLDILTGLFFFFCLVAAASCSTSRVLVPSIVRLPWSYGAFATGTHTGHFPPPPTPAPLQIVIQQIENKSS